MKKNSVLIVDDDKSNLLVLNDILSPDYALYLARSGADAIEKTNRNMPDLILLDVVMPEMDGYAVLAALKSSEKTRHIPVIFITGLSDPEAERKGLSLGAADYIGKPFSPVIVKLRVQNHMRIINQTRLIISSEIAIKSSRDRSEFLSRMSHEMRTPMNAIMGIATLAQKTTDPGKKDEMLGKITDSADHLLRLIDDILDMSDIENGKLCLENAVFSFSAMIGSIIREARAEAAEKNRTFMSSVDPSIPDLIIGDERRLAKVIRTLLSNAVKYTQDKGSVQFAATATKIENETLTLQIEVVDDGIGMTTEQQQKLFIPFEQADGGIDRKYGGAGLGLAISKHIVTLMGGDIRIESDPDHGTRAVFTVHTRLKTPDIDHDLPPSFQGKTALLVDDVEINREIIMAALEETGLAFECAGNGREAVDLFESSSGHFDVIFMDINMPEMDGVEATRRIRALSEQGGTAVPIIAVTANVLADEIEAYLMAGMSAHIGKPVDFNKLLNITRRYLT